MGENVCGAIQMSVTQFKDWDLHNIQLHKFRILLQELRLCQSCF